MTLAFQTIVDISLELDPNSYSMRTPAGFKKDMQFEMEVLKEHDAPGGAGQIVRGVHMRLHAGSHVDAPEHNVRGGTQIHQLPLELFMGDAVVADLREATWSVLQEVVSTLDVDFRAFVDEYLERGFAGALMSRWLAKPRLPPLRLLTRTVKSCSPSSLR